MSARVIARGRRAALALVALVVPVVTAERAGANERQACVDAAERGQELFRARRLLEAREELAICARDTCPGIVRRDCIGWALEIENALPTIVLKAVDADGHDILQATVTIDDKPVPQAIEGKPVAVDAGPHTLRLVRPEGSAEVTFVARENEKGREVTIRLPASASPQRSDQGMGATATTTTPPAAPPQGGMPPLTYALGGVGIAATAVFAYFGIKGLSDRATSCNDAHVCDHATYNAVVTNFAVASVALGVAVVSLGGALWAYLAHKPSAASGTGYALRF